MIRYGMIYVFMFTCVWMKIFYPGNRDWSRNVKTKLPQWSLSVFDICLHKTDKAWRSFFIMAYVLSPLYTEQAQKRNCVPYCESLHQSSFLSFLVFLCRSICEYFSKPFASTSFRHTHILGRISSSLNTCFAIPLLYFSSSLSHTPSLTTAKVCR